MNVKKFVITVFGVLLALSLVNVVHAQDVIQTKDHNGQNVTIITDHVSYMEQYDDHVVITTKDGEVIDLEYANDLRAKQEYQEMQEEVQGEK